MYKSIALCLLPVLIACSSDSSDDQAADTTGNDTDTGIDAGNDTDTGTNGPVDQAAIDALGDAIVTGRDATATNNWLCEFMGTDGAAQFTDSYGFFADGQGTASHGGFTYSVETGDIIRIEKPGDTPTAYEIVYIEFSSTAFANDGFNAIVDGQYFDTGDTVQQAIRCSRTGEALR